MNTNKRIKNMVASAMLCGLTVLLGFTPLGMLPLPAPLPSPTTVHIPVIIATLFLGLPHGIIVSICFGLVSFTRAVQMPIGFNVFFMNPFIAILPRLTIPIFAYLVNKLLTRFLKHKSTCLVLASIAGSLANTVFTLGSILIFYGKELNELINNAIAAGGITQQYANNAAMYVLSIIAVPYGLAEATLSALLIPAIVIALRKAIK